jgi:DNA-binding transcriptional MerR regulator
MKVRVPIGEFSRMTYLSVKALHLYHESGILEPAAVDPATGYRYYDTAQVPTAQVIRRLRDLDMPLAKIRTVVAARGVAERNAAIGSHLVRMQKQLAATQTTVAALQALFERPPTPLVIEYRAIPVTRAAAIAEQVEMDTLAEWWPEAFDELYDALEHEGMPQAGLGGALYSKDFFEQEAGQVVAFVPIPGHLAARGRFATIEVPAAELAVAVHRGAFSELDQTYGALGSYVAEREIGVDGPIREYYAITAADTADEAQHRTEVCWPVFQTRVTDNTRGASR